LSSKTFVFKELGIFFPSFSIRKIEKMPQIIVIWDNKAQFYDENIINYSAMQNEKESLIRV
tara:strand:- start:85925 stop:86107 length:183 start_codon:yes stop_codon:yes gene_type:complete